MMSTLSGTMADLDGQGLTHHFQVVGHRVRTLDGGGPFSADQVLIRECHRFEGVSDPDDMAIVYVLQKCATAPERRRPRLGRMVDQSPLVAQGVTAGHFLACTLAFGLAPLAPRPR